MKAFQIADFRVPSQEYVSTVQDENIYAEVKLVSQLGASYVDVLSMGKVGGGKLGTRQQAQACALRDELLASVTDAVKAAGWKVSDSLGFTSYKRNAHVQDSVTHTPEKVYPVGSHAPVGTHAGKTETGKDESKKSITVGTYTRTVSTKSITFVCARCGETVTQQRYPSPKPMYCSDECRNEVKKEQTRLRVQKLRAKQKQGSHSPG